MSFDITQDFMTTLRPASGSATLGTVPFIDGILNTLGLAGILSIAVSSTAPVTNQPTTIWVEPETSSWAGNAQVWLWSEVLGAYQLATPALFAEYIVALAPSASTTERGVVQIGEGISVTTAGLIALEPATTSTLGGVIVGNGLGVNSGGTLTLDIASASQLGGVTIGEGISVNPSNGLIAIEPATTSTLGGVIVGNGLSVASDGTETLDVATTSQLGGIKVGNGLAVASDGTTTLDIATGVQLGGVKIGSGVTVATDGTISVSAGTSYTLPPATTNSLGGVIVGSGLAVASDGTLSVSGGSSSISGTILAAYAGTAQTNTAALGNFGTTPSGPTVFGHNIASISTTTGTADPGVPIDGAFTVTFSEPATGDYVVVLGTFPGNSSGTVLPSQPVLFGTGNIDGVSIPNANGFSVYLGAADENDPGDVGFAVPFIVINA